MNGQRMASKHRHAHTGASYPKIGNVQDLAGLIAQLLLLIRLARAVINDIPRQRQRVIGDGGNIRTEVFRCNNRTVVGEFHVPVPHLSNLLGQRIHTRDSRAGYRLVGGHVQTGEASGVVKRLQHRHRRHGRAVRVSDDPFNQVVLLPRVHFRDDQRHLRVFTPGGGIIHHHSARCGKDRGVLLGRGPTRREQRDVNTLQGLLCHLRQVLHHNVFPTERKGRASGPCRSKKPNIIQREITLFKNRTHHAANLARGTDNGDGGHGEFLPTPTYINISK